MELQIIDKNRLPQEERKELEKRVDEAITKHKTDSAVIQSLVLDSVAALTAGSARSAALANQGALKHIWGEITGKNARLQNDVNQNFARAQYASQQLIQKLAEQNLLSLELISEVNFKLNEAILKNDKDIQEVKERINKTVKDLQYFFNKLENELNKFKKEQQRFNQIVNLQDTYWEQSYNGFPIKKLNKAEALTVIVERFYDLTSGKLSKDEIARVRACISEVQQKDLPLEGQLERLNFKPMAVVLCNKLAVLFKENIEPEGFMQAIYAYFSMRELMDGFLKLEEINTSYGLNNEGIAVFLNNAINNKVCLPVVGKFSTGKSALMNTILQRPHLLQEDVTPETAVPTEITTTVSDEEAVIYKVDGSTLNLTIQKFKNADFNHKEVAYIRIKLKANDLLRCTPDLMLVDMPGLESGNISHNEVIDQYLPKSMAYMITFSAEDMTLKSSTLNILKELCLNEMPVCIVITKSDKVSDDILTANLRQLQESLNKNFSQTEFKYAITSSAKNDIKSLTDFLYLVQQEAQTLLKKKWSVFLAVNLADTLSYLRELYYSTDSNDFNAQAKEQEMAEKYEEFTQKMEKERNEFSDALPEIITGIKNDVQVALESDIDTLTSMALNNNNITERVNMKVRLVMTESLKKRFTNKLQMYLEKLKAISEIELTGPLNTGTLSVDNADNGSGLSTGVVVGGATICAAGAAFAGIITGGLAIAAVVGVAILAHLFGKGSEQQDNNKQRDQVRYRLLNEVIPSVVSDVGGKVEAYLQQQVNKISEEFESRFSKKQDLLKKAWNDAKEQRINSESERMKYKNRLEENIKTLEDIQNDLQ